MKKEEFLDASREYFKSIGFQTLKKTKFYYDTDEITLRVNLYHSNFGEYYYVEYSTILFGIQLLPGDWVMIKVKCLR